MNTSNSLRVTMIILAGIWTVAMHGASGQVAPGKTGGRVLDAEGKAVSGADVYLVRNSGYEVPVVEKVKTDAQGRFELKVPEGAPSRSLRKRGRAKYGCNWFDG